MHGDRGRLIDSRKSKGFKGATYQTNTYDMGDGLERVEQIIYYPNYFGKGPKTVHHEWTTQRELPKLEDAVIVLTDVGDEVLASGRTYDVRSLLKAAGFRWRPNEKVWAAPANIDIPSLVEKLEDRGVEVEFERGEV